MFSFVVANRILEGWLVVGGGVIFTGWFDFFFFFFFFDVGSFDGTARAGWFTGCGNDLWRI